MLVMYVAESPLASSVVGNVSLRSYVLSSKPERFSFRFNKKNYAELNLEESYVID